MNKTQGTEQPTAQACSHVFAVVDLHQHDMLKVLDELDDIISRGMVLPGEAAALHDAIRVVLAAYLPGLSR